MLAQNKNIRATLLYNISPECLNRRLPSHAVNIKTGRRMTACKNAKRDTSPEKIINTRSAERVMEKYAVMLERLVVELSLPVNI